MATDRTCLFYKSVKLPLWKIVIRQMAIWCMAAALLPKKQSCFVIYNFTLVKMFVKRSPDVCGASVLIVASVDDMRMDPPEKERSTG